MALWSRKRPRRHPPLTASAQRINRQDGETIRRLQQPWQSRAFIYYDQIGEVKYASQFYARAISMLELYVAAVDPDTGELERVDDDEVQGYVDRIQDPGGGRANLLGSYGRLLFLAGECYLLVTLDEDGEEVWEMLSTDELRAMGDGTFTRYRAPSLGATEIRTGDADMWHPLDGEAVAYRIWKRHPRYSALADSPMQGILDICEELLLLTRAVASRAMSRIPAGVLIIPDEVTLPALDAVGEEDPDEDPFLDDLEAHFEAPLQDRGSASAAVPFFMRVGGEHADKIRMLELHDPAKFYPETGLRQECITRMALGLDLPPEVLLGTADANHWTSWQIDEQTWKGHLQPVAQTLVDDLTSAYLRPAMRADGYANWGDYVIAFDASAVINHPDRSKDAKDLHAVLALSDEALREAAGFDETDAIQDVAEMNRRLGVMLRDSSVALFGIPSVRTAIEPAAGEIVSAKPGSGPVTTPAESAGTGPPAQPAQQDRQLPVAASGERLSGAIAASVERCRELAGSRLVSKAQGNEDALELIRDVPKPLVCATLGEVRARTLCPGMSARALVAGGTSALSSTLLSWDVDHAVAARACQVVEQHAAATLWKQKPGPARELEP